MIIFGRFLFVLLVLEVVAFLAPFVVPSAWYYSRYLGEERAIKQQDFYKGELPSIMDPYAGWKNKPLFEKNLWSVDEWGARAHKPVPLQRTPGISRVLFLGNSLINGGDSLPVEDSISYQFDEIANEDNQSIEVKNFAKMAYNAGQSYVDLKYNLLKFKPDHVVLGLSEAAYAGLNNLFLPLYLRDQGNMPYVKPGFYEKDGRLQIIKPPHTLAQGDYQGFIDYLKQHDGYYVNFKRYQHFEMSPLLKSLDYLYHKIRNMIGYFTFNGAQFNTLFAILTDLEALADKEGFQISYLYFPTAKAFGESLLWRSMPDFYQQRFNILKNSSASKAASFEVINIRRYLLQDGGRSTDYFLDDLYHFNGHGNHIIAKALYDTIGHQLYP